MITTDKIKELRNKTGMSVMQCKKALEKAGGDLDKAIGALREQGRVIATKKAQRDLNSGVVQAYIHAEGAIGAMIELLCETDFVAKNDEFKRLAYDIAMQVAATDDNIVEGGAEKLLEQPYIKDPDRTVGDLVQEAVQKFGERTEIGEIAKFAI